MELDWILSQYFSKIDQIKLTIINNGLINKTYLVTLGDQSYILQNINTEIFKFPKNIIDNHNAIFNHLNQSNYDLEIAEPLKTKFGKDYVEIASGFWRLTTFIEDCHTIHKINSSEIAFTAAKAFSYFYATVNTKEIPLLHILPGFIDFKKRTADYNTALLNANSELKNIAKKEIEFINNYLSLPNLWLDLQAKNELPKRIIHADPKISNILFDKSKNPLAIIDLDTIMHDSILYDFGDMIRSYTNKTTEDDAEMIENFDPKIYVAVKKGFLYHLENELTNVEKNNLDYAAKLIIYIQAVRFLTDFLNGSTYYKTDYAQQNLDRTKNQINLLKGLLKMQIT